MIDPRKRISVLYAMTLIAMLSLVGWSYLRLTNARQAATSATADAAMCLQVSKRIERLRAKPVVASVAGVQAGDSTGRFERAATQAALPKDAIARIAPSSPRRIGETAYLEKPTQLTLREITLSQLVSFLHAMAIGESRTEVRSLRITAPRDIESGDRWSAEVTLTDLLYSPRKPKS